MESTPTVPETHAQRLARLLARLLPHDAERIATSEWGKAGPPYQFKTAEDGRQKLIIEDRLTESRVGFVGSSRLELLDQLEAHVDKVAPAA